MQTFPFSWILLAQHGLLRSCGFLFKSLLIQKSVFPPDLFLLCKRSKNRQGHKFSVQTPLLRLVVKLGCIQSSPLRGNQSNQSFSHD